MHKKAGQECGNEKELDSIASHGAYESPWIPMVRGPPGIVREGELFPSADLAIWGKCGGLGKQKVVYPSGISLVSTGPPRAQGKPRASKAPIPRGEEGPGALPRGPVPPGLKNQVYFLKGIIQPP